MVVLHHPMSSIINDRQCLFAGICIVVYSCLIHAKNLFGSVHAEVFLLNYVEESILRNFLLKDLEVLLYMIKVLIALLLQVAVYELNRRIVKISQDEALEFVRAEVGNYGFA